MALNGTIEMQKNKRFGIAVIARQNEAIALNRKADEVDISRVERTKNHSNTRKYRGSDS